MARSFLWQTARAACEEALRAADEALRAADEAVSASWCCTANCTVPVSCVRLSHSRACTLCAGFPAGQCPARRFTPAGTRRGKARHEGAHAAMVTMAPCHVGADEGDARAAQALLSDVYQRVASVLSQDASYSGKDVLTLLRRTFKEKVKG